MKKQRRKRIAAIDVGTNSFHLIVAEASSATGRFHVLDREKELVRLGSSASDMKILTPAAIERALSTLRRYADIASSYKATIRAVATSAVREARNSAEFIRTVERETGIRLEVASGAEEVRLIHLGVLQALPLYHKRILLFDIGGGSTEFLVGKARRTQYVNSLKIGAVRLTRRFFPDGRTNPGSIRDCRSYVRGLLAPVVRDTRGIEIEECVATSGTAISLARHLELTGEGSASRSLNGFRISSDEIARVTKRVEELPTTVERSSLPGIESSRAEILPAGLLILDQIVSEFGIDRLLVSEYALREGIVRDSIEKAEARRRIPGLTDIQRASVDHTLEQFQTDKSHSRQVAKLALDVFDQTRDLHGMGPVERNYLEVASLLHEVGLHISHSQHHRHSYYLIRHSDIVGYSEREKEIIANTARYHRKSHPKEKHAEFRVLSEPDKQTVRKLAGILRIADGLDRRHTSSVTSVTARTNGSTLELRVAGRRSPKLDIELWGANLKKELFEEVFGVSVELAAV